MKKIEFRTEGEEAILKQIRDRLGISQQELAHKLGTGVSTISRWERGASRVTLTIPQVKKLADLLSELDLTIHDIPDYFGPSENAQ